MGRETAESRYDLAAVQRISFEILKDIVRVCDANDIDYMLYYGSLLGAVRHRGIIPWDNDIDLAMTRDNYERFLAVAPQQLSPENEIRIMGSRHLSELKIGRRGTLHCLNFAQDLDIMKQVVVDIFLVDHLKPQALKHLSILDPLKEILRYAGLSWDEKRLLFRCIDRSSHCMKWLYKSALASLHLFKLIFTADNLDRFVSWLHVDKSGTSEHMGIVQQPLKNRPWPAGFKYLTVPFDGLQVKIPDCYDLLLRGRYGDYMQLPPEDQRLPNHIEDWIFKEL